MRESLLTFAGPLAWYEAGLDQGIELGRQQAFDELVRYLRRLDAEDYWTLYPWQYVIELVTMRDENGNIR